MLTNLAAPLTECVCVCVKDHSAQSVVPTLCLLQMESVFNCGKELSLRIIMKMSSICNCPVLGAGWVACLPEAHCVYMCVCVGTYL